MSFTTCIDLIANYTQETVTHMMGDSNTSMGHHIQSYLDSVSSCVQSLRDTNAFMLMTINRCIDYAKATKGVKLVPKLETIDLLETMQLPLSCMRNVQSRIAIVLNAVPENVCSHIITDKQWLQENLLCLLSNAVKYSSKGEVTVTVKPIDHIFKYSSNDSTSRCGSTRPTPITKSESSRSLKSSLSAKMLSFTSSHASSTYSSSSISNQPLPSWLLIEVEDTGIGVPHDAMNFLFQPFKQTQRLAGGTGLGLYSLAKRIEALSGEYGVRDRKDGQKGSVFWFTIPYRPDEITAKISTPVVRTYSFDHIRKSLTRDSWGSTSDSTIRNLMKPENAGSSLLMDERASSKSSHNKASNLKVLLVDDAMSIVKMTSLMLRKLGHQITPAENGEVAVKIVESQWAEHGKSFDVILMDLQMPVMDGLEATKRIRAMEGVLRYDHQEEVDNAKHEIRFLPRHFIVGVSANSDPETESNAMDHGADAFIAKPFTVDTFANLINDQLLI